METPPKALTIAGSDSGGGAGIQADLKTFMALGVYGTSVITAVTAQNAQGVLGALACDPAFVQLQIEAVMSDIGASAGKLGMLANAPIMKAVAESLDKWPIPNLVVDPVMVATTGASLMESGALDLFREAIIPKAAILTPNLAEAKLISGMEIGTDAQMRRAASVLAKMGAKAVLIKGGHLIDTGSSDDLFYDGDKFITYAGRRIHSPNTHGSGCTLSAAIAALLAKGLALREAVGQAKLFVTAAIEHSYGVGRGPGPLNHAWKLDGR